ncbi:MAG TPA: hypothetical protein VGC87_26730 [Pyrinomonadaceae bacterium]|jgi:DNA repair exonuclease SbcCD ATPase subunit
MTDYLLTLVRTLAAPAIVIAVLGALGKWYLDKVLGRQTENLKASLVQETERLKVSLAKKLAVSQAKLQALQQVSKAVYAARRASRDLHDLLFPQNEDENARLARIAESDVEQLFNSVHEENAALSESSRGLEEQLFSTKEYLSPDLIDDLEQILTAHHDVRSKVGAFFAPTKKPPTFIADLIALFENAERQGIKTDKALVLEKQRLLDSTVG